MKRTSILRFLCSVLAALVVAAAGVSVTLALSDRPGVIQAAGADSGLPTSTTKPMPSTTAAPTTTSTSTTTTTTPTTTRPPATEEPAETLRRGDRGAAVRTVQTRLRNLGYWLGGVNDTFGPLTEQAVTAFQKVEGLTPDGVVGPATLAALGEANRPESSASGDLIEVDKARQVLFVVRAGEVAWTLNVSTGTEKPYVVNGRTELADTPPGHWKVSWAVNGNDVGELGALYRPRYFHSDGIAVHGYHSVPPYPASHGCVRVTDAAIDWIWANDLMPVGSSVWVH